MGLAGGQAKTLARDILQTAMAGHLPGKERQILATGRVPVRLFGGWMDRRDAEGIARFLHLGWFRPVHCKSVSAQEIRAVLGARKAIQQNIIALEMSLRGLLRNFGLKVGAISRGKLETRIRELADGNPMLEAATEPMLRARASLRQELAGLEKRVRQLAWDDPVCQRLMSMPGIGVVVALTFRAAIDDPGRFRSSKRVGPWVGLTPSRSLMNGTCPAASPKRVTSI